MSAAGSLRVLIIEDDDIDRMQLQRLLAGSSLEVAEVKCANRLATAIDLLRQSTFDVLLLDLGLPDSQGIESIVQIQTRVPDVPIIVLSGLDDEKTATTAVQKGVQDYLIKGQVDSTLLMRSIRYALERKKAERQLQVAEQRYRTIFENSAVAIMMADKEERLISWNGFSEQLLGMTPADLLGRRVESLYPPAEWERIRTMSLRQKGMQHHLETQMIHKNGTVIDIDICLSVLAGPDGESTGSIGVVRDITEPKRIREILDRKQKNLEAIFDAAPAAMLLVNEAMVVVRANEAIRQISGREFRDIIGRNPCEALGCAHGPDAPSQGQPPSACEKCSLRRMIQTAFETGKPIHGVEIRAVLSSYHENMPWFLVSVEPVVIDSGQHMVVAFDDITDRKRAEEALKETMELKAQFISTVSHELRTPMTSIREAVTIVLEGIAGKIGKDQKHFLDIAKRNIDRLSRLIDEVLDFQKLGAGKMQFQMQENRIERVVEEAYTTMQPYAQKKGLHLSMELDCRLPPAVFDNDRMIQVLTNLLSNAIKFTPEGGRVRVSAQHREEYLAIQVSDTGYGIPKESLGKLFGQFYRVQRPGKEIKGTGLGLAIVEKIVNAHNGRIDVESEVGKGTTFTVWLPLAPVRLAEAPAEEADKHLEETLAQHP